MRLKSNLKSFLRLLKQKNEKNFISFEDALIYCNKKQKGAYESILLSKYRFEKFNNYLNSGASLFSYSMLSLLFTVTKFINENNGLCPNIVDFGGACGESVFLLQKILGNEIFSKSWIIETEQHILESSNWQFAENLQYSNNLEQTINSNKIDIFFSSGTLQYLENPLKPLKLIANKSVPIVALTRNHFSNDKIIVQESNFSSNGFGSHIDRYGNPNLLPKCIN